MRRRRRNSQGRMVPQRQHAVLGAAIVVLFTSIDPAFVIVLVVVATAGDEGFQASISPIIVCYPYLFCFTLFISHNRNKDGTMTRKPTIRIPPKMNEKKITHRLDFLLLLHLPLNSSLLALPCLAFRRMSNPLFHFN